MSGQDKNVCLLEPEQSVLNQHSEMCVTKTTKDYDIR